MPKNKVSDPITDQDIAFARLVLPGAMTDRRAADRLRVSSEKNSVPAPMHPDIY